MVWQAKMICGFIFCGIPTLISYIASQVIFVNIRTPMKSTKI